jgi:hypothetical protein
MEGKMERIRVTCVQLIMLLLLVLPTSGYGGSAEEFLILQDIGGYRNMGKGGGLGSGILAATGHFNKDHADESYSTMYYSDVSELGLNVQVTRHAGVDSDQWLLHEVEDSYRDPEYNNLGLAIQGARIRNFNGGNIIALRGNSYSWISNNTVIVISYTDLEGTKPEPLEVVQAYLEKYPSTLPEGFVFNAAHDEQWIKDEMSRRLWLGEKWFAWQSGGNVEMSKALDEVVDHLEEFLDYRQRYFGMNADQEKMELIAAKRSNDDVAIKAKLTQYKQWWEGHKGDSITLP